MKYAHSVPIVVTFGRPICPIYNSSIQIHAQHPAYLYLCRTFISQLEDIHCVRLSYSRDVCAHYKQQSKKYQLIKKIEVKHIFPNSSLYSVIIPPWRICTFCHCLTCVVMCFCFIYNAAKPGSQRPLHRLYFCVPLHSFLGPTISISIVLHHPPPLPTS